MEEEGATEEGIALNEIVPGLFLGSILAASDRSILDANKITHVLTVAVGMEPFWPQDFTYKIVSVLDAEDTNLLTHMDECSEFIHSTITNSGVMLVHCSAGVSRSVTIVISYLMKYQGMDRDSALAHVRAVRPQIAPNPGFLIQLAVYQALLRRQENTATSEQEELIKLYSVERGYLDYLAHGVLSEEFYAKPLSAKERGGMYVCSKCRQKLFSTTHVIAHHPGQRVERVLIRHSNNQRKSEFRRKQEQRKGQAGWATEGGSCSSLFIVGMDWMRQLHLEGSEEGRLLCPGECGSVIGSWAWKGKHCSCGTWIEPALQVVRSKVDLRK